VIFPTWLLNWELYYLCYHWTLCLVVVTTNICHTLLWDTLNMNNFYFLFLLFSNFIGILFSFFLFLYFRQWRGTWHCSHMMWYHRPRRWWKNLEDDVRAHVYNIVALRQTWGRDMDIRISLSIGSMNQAYFVYIGL